MVTTAKIVGYDGRLLTLAPEDSVTRELLQKECREVELRLDDGRSITAVQRKKIFALVREISDWSGHDPEYIRERMTWDFRSIDGRPDFSLSDVDRTTAREFIDYLIGFCFQWGVPTRDSLLSRTEDIGRYLYLCLEHRKCAICNARAQVHHVDRIGMGRDREEVVHVGLKAIALCPRHHEQAHKEEAEMFEKWHIYGIPLDEYLCRTLSLPGAGPGKK